MNAVTKAIRNEVSASLRRASLAADIGGMSDRELLELFRQSPIPEQLVGEAQAARRGRRAQLIAAKQREIESMEREVPALQRKDAACAAMVVEKQAELEGAKRAQVDAHHELLHRGLRTQAIVNAADAELTLSAPSLIDARIAAWQAEWDRLRNRGPFQVLEIRPHAFAGSTTRKDLDATAEHHERIGQFMESLQVAIMEAEKLKVVVLDASEASAALDNIEANMTDLAKAARLALGQ
jgi:hypothetical protein